MRFPSLTVVVPVKHTGRGKSRLQLPDDRRAALAAAFAQDTVSAIARVCAVLVVAEDVRDLDPVAGLAGVTVRRTEAVGLNPAIRDGLDQLDPALPAAVLPADLPGLDPADLAAALDLGTGRGFAVVPDRDTIGTTLLMADRADRVDPHYGGASFRRHQEAGAIPLPVGARSSLRRDVDLPGDLDELRASTGTLGPATAALLAGWARSA
ncbi:2-phospho-L-lactate guanylyltransferase [Nakamurella sp. YIM 132087]|uniref:2-phospho-L-lactate guanylyltransferase n=1 Tax=Nakamurella alba TaxID=2665158 RepID=A0A7K1FQQ7_9ACTN|nr:2-phospho-L-lactate guanylyltransferase [Nakamurella alba]MTD16410.1 2-phospho-L-lactate guanylyltransferase [Nakamurella alba]